MFDELEDVGNGLRLYPKDIMGHLLLVWAIEYIAHSPTSFSQPGKPSDVVTVDVVDLADHLGTRVTDPETGEFGMLARRSWWRQNHLIKMLKLKIGSSNPLLVQMAKGGASQGRNAPFVLTSMTAHEGAVALANEWLQAHPDFTPSRPMPKMEIPEDTRDPWEGQNEAQLILPPPRPPAGPVQGAPAPAQTQLEAQAQETLNRLAAQGRAGAAAWGAKAEDKPPF
jgi:hypothetical protein